MLAKHWKTKILPVVRDVVSEDNDSDANNINIALVTDANKKRALTDSLLFVKVPLEQIMMFRIRKIRNTSLENMYEFLRMYAKRISTTVPAVSFCKKPENK